MKFTGPKVKRSRRLGIALTPKAAEIMERRPFPPGQHGPARRGRPRKTSDYSRQLLEKQRLRAQYNVHERQMRNYFRKASRQVGNTADRLAQLLETRLDAVVSRGGLARTIYQARQVVNHGHVLVNGKKVTSPGYQLRPGDVVTIREKSRQMPLFEEAMDGAAPPAYLTLDKDAMVVQFTYMPPRSEVPVICEFDQVIEFYSR